MRSLRTAATVSTALLLVAGLGLAGCSGSSPAGDGASSQAQSEQGGGSLTAENFAERITAAQLDAGSVHISQQTDAGETSTKAEADMTIAAEPADANLSMSMELPTGAAEIRLVDGAMYMNMGELSMNKFVELDGSVEGMPDPSEILSQIDPQSQMQAFSDAIVDFESEPATEQIDGVDTTKYTLTLDTAKLFAENPISGATPEDIGETIAYEVFVGDDDLPRRVSMGFSGSTSVTDFSRWGEPVEIAAPGADELLDISALVP